MPRHGTGRTAAGHADRPRWPPTPHRGVRRTRPHPVRTTGGRPRRRRADQPPDRRAALRHREDRRNPPQPRIPETRRQLSNPVGAPDDNLALGRVLWIMKRVFETDPDRCDVDGGLVHEVTLVVAGGHGPEPLELVDTPLSGVALLVAFGVEARRSCTAAAACGAVADLVGLLRNCRGDPT